MGIIVRKCCCCIDLRVAALILGWLGIIKIAIDFISYGTQQFKFESIIEDLIVIAVHGCLIYGALERKHLYLLPWLIVGGIAITVHSVATVALFCLRSPFARYLSEPHGTKTYSEQTNMVDGYIFLGLIWLLAMLLANAFLIHLWFVIYSFYKELKSTDQTTKNSVDAKV